MDLNYKIKKIIDIYDEISSKGLFKISNKKEKFLIFILPYILISLLCIISICSIKNEIIIYYISPLLLFIILWLFNFLYMRHRNKIFNIKNKSNNDTHYNLFINNLKKHKINYKEIILFIDIMTLDNDSTNFNKTGIGQYLSLIFIPILRVYFISHFIDMKLQIIIILFLLLFLIPVVIFILKNIFNIKKNKYYIILQYLKRRKIELKYCMPPNKMLLGNRH
jgi:hypothetical protein